MLSTPQKPPVLRLLTPGLDFLRPYINAELSDIYDIIYDDSTTPDTTLAIVREGEENAIDKKVINTLLITPDTIIGTGMNGIGRQLAEGIARGRLYHIKGNETRVSVIHATAIAQAARMAAATPGRFVVAEAEPVSIDTLIEALATRINGRRVYTIGPKWSKWLMSADLRKLTTTDRVTLPDFTTHFPDFAPTPACEYLTTHDYSDDTI